MLDVEDNLPELVVNVAWLFAPEDDTLHHELEIYLSPLKQSGQIRTWSEKDIVPGTSLQEIEHSLFSADIIVLLISAHLIHQFYTRMEEIWSWYHDGNVRIIPIVTSPCGYHDTPFGELATLPTGNKTLTEWRNRQAAYANIEQGIQRVVKLVLAQKWEKTGATHCNAQRYEQALQAFVQALKYDTENATAYKYKGDALYGMMKYEEAIMAYKHATKLHPRCRSAWVGLSQALEARGRQVHEYYDKRAEEAEEQANKLENEKRRGEQDERD